MRKSKGEKTETLEKVARYRASVMTRLIGSMGAVEIEEALTCQFLEGYKLGWMVKEWIEKEA